MPFIFVTDAQLVWLRRFAAAVPGREWLAAATAAEQTKDEREHTAA